MSQARSERFQNENVMTVINYRVIYAAIRSTDSRRNETNVRLLIFPLLSAASEGKQRNDIRMCQQMHCKVENNVEGERGAHRALQCVRCF